MAYRDRREAQGGCRGPQESPPDLAEGAWVGGEELAPVSVVEDSLQGFCALRQGAVSTAERVGLRDCEVQRGRDNRPSRGHGKLWTGNRDGALAPRRRPVRNLGGEGQGRPHARYEQVGLYMADRRQQGPLYRRDGVSAGV